MSSMTVPSSTARQPAARRRAEETFVDYVLQLCQDARVRADLRSGVRRPPDQWGRMDRYLSQRLSETMDADAVHARYVIAALIAARPRAAREPDAARDTDAAHEPDTAASGDGKPGVDWQARRRRANLGSSLAQAVNEEIVRAGAAEEELVAMARLSLDALRQRLPALTERLQAKGVPVDWAVLLDDLTRWTNNRDKIVTRWQVAYYQARARTEEAEPLPVKRQPEIFIDRVRELCASSTKARAELTRGLGLPVDRCHQMHGYLVPFLPERPHPDDWRAHYAVAALIASRPPAARKADVHTADADAPVGDRRRADMGAWLAQAVSAGLFKPAAAEEDLHLMARLNTDALHARLPALARRLQGNGGRVRIDWRVLLDDLARWSRDHEQIAARWMDSYFLIRSREDRKNSDNTSDSNSGKNEENN